MRAILRIKARHIAQERTPKRARAPLAHSARCACAI